MNHVIILAAGQGHRMQLREDKLLMPAAGKPLIYYSLMAFNDHPQIESITVVVNKNNKTRIERIIREYNFSKVKKPVLGGQTRQDSLEKGLDAITKIAKNEDLIMVHNGANPLPSHEEISDTIHLAEEHGACIVGHFITSTVKEIDDQQILRTHDRERFFLAETPQAARYNILKKALKEAHKNQLAATDEAMLLEAIGQPIKYVEAHEDNFKVTTRTDYEKLQAVLGELPADFRVGLGQDSHVFEEKEKGLVLAGIEFKDELKLQANSDGDVILHAVFNALSQAIGDLSIGFYADEICESGIKDSKKYLDLILGKIRKQKFRLNSLGLMIECKTPHIDTIATRLKKSLSNLLELDVKRIGITATSGEEMTIFGAGAGIQCFAIVSLVKA